MYTKTMFWYPLTIHALTGAFIWMHNTPGRNTVELYLGRNSEFHFLTILHISARMFSNSGNTRHVISAHTMPAVKYKYDNYIMMTL